MIGGNVDLDHLFQIPQKDARIMGGRGGEANSSKDSNGGERVRRDENKGGRRPPLNSPPRIWPLEPFSRRTGCTGAPEVQPLALGQRLQSHAIPAGPELPAKPSRYNRPETLECIHITTSLAQARR